MTWQLLLAGYITVALVFSHLCAYANGLSRRDDMEPLVWVLVGVIWPVFAFLLLATSHSESESGDDDSPTP